MPEQTTSARRTKTRFPGVWWRQNAKGRRRYEITFIDSTGKRRWQVVDGGEEDARRELGRVQDRLFRGERVAPERRTFAEVADEWLPRQSALRPRTIEKYENGIRVHLKPRIGHLRMAEIDEDVIARLISDLREAGLKPWTIRGVLTPLGRILNYAVRHGFAARNPLRTLEKGERPKTESRRQRVLNDDEIGELLEAAGALYRPILATAAYTGMRLSEVLGLVWGDVDLEGGFIEVEYQLSRKGERVEPKTPQAKRKIVLMPALGRLLREHKLASPYSKDEDLVFCTARGTPHGYRNIERRGLDAAAEKAGLEDLHFHDLRHTYASVLIELGADIVFLSNQLGHANPAITLGVYSHMIRLDAHAERTRQLLEQRGGNVLETSGLFGPLPEQAGGFSDVPRLQEIRH
jgi:integrase